MSREPKLHLKDPDYSGLGSLCGHQDSPSLLLSREDFDRAPESRRCKLCPRSLRETPRMYSRDELLEVRRQNMAGMRAMPVPSLDAEAPPLAYQKPEPHGVAKAGVFILAVALGFSVGLFF